MENQMKESEQPVYISVAEFADITKKTKQYIYQISETKLKNYCSIIDNQKMIDKRALEEVFNLNEEEQNKAVVESTGEEQSVVEILSRQIELLNEQLEVKDVQISELNERLKDSQRSLEQSLNALEKNQIALDQAQKLNALDKPKFLDAEKSMDEIGKKKRWFKRN